jgi:hypothetical protein
MARLATQLGRTFEARVFLTLAISEDTDREDLKRELTRLSENSRTAVAHPRTLAELLH